MKFIENVLKGAAIGIANVIPGVSGGTIAFVLGVYDKLTEAIGEILITEKAKKIEYIKFLFQIGLGVILGIVFFARIIDFLYKASEEATNMFFMGLIISSIPLIIQDERKKMNKKSFLCFVLGFVIVMFFSIFSHFGGEKSSIINITKSLTFFYSIKLFFCGLLAAGAMVVPGVSGSLLLLLLGEYQNVISFVKNWDILPIAIIGVGAVVGILVFAKIIDYLLKVRRTETIFLILGLIVASIIEIYPGITMKTSFIIKDIITFMLGFLLVYLVKRFDKNKTGGA